MFTPVKSVMVSKVDKIMVHENESLSEVNLLKGVKLIEGGYIDGRSFSDFDRSINSLIFTLPLTTRAIKK